MLSSVRLALDGVVLVHKYTILAFRIVPWPTVGDLILPLGCNKAADKIFIFERVHFDVRQAVLLARDAST